MKDKYTIYKLFFLDDERIYIGKTNLRLSQRMNTHIQSYKRGLHTNRNLIDSFGKYPIENLRIEPLEVCSFEDGSDREVYWITYYRELERKDGKVYLYNIYNGSSGSVTFNLTEEQRKKISCKVKGLKKSETHKQKLREVNLGKKHTEESKQKQRDWYTNMGGWSIEQRKMMGEAASYKRTDETKKRMSDGTEISIAAKKGMTVEEWREHKRQALKYWLEDKATLTQVKEKFNVDKSMLYVWKKKYLEEGQI
jgi:hypothetical protein